MAYSKNDLSAAIQAAETFLWRAQPVYQQFFTVETETSDSIHGPDNAAMKRASMDLTRILAVLRRTGRAGR